MGKIRSIRGENQVSSPGGGSKETGRPLPWQEIRANRADELLAEGAAGVSTAPAEVEQATGTGGGGTGSFPGAGRRRRTGPGPALSLV